MEKRKKERHEHLIIQEITAAPADCYSVWAWWEGDSKRETVKFEFSRVPCFAIVSHCQKAYEDQKNKVRTRDLEPLKDRPGRPAGRK